MVGREPKTAQTGDIRPLVFPKSDNIVIRNKGILGGRSGLLLGHSFFIMGGPMKKKDLDLTSEIKAIVDKLVKGGIYELGIVDNPFLRARYWNRCIIVIKHFFSTGIRVHILAPGPGYSGDFVSFKTVMRRHHKKKAYNDDGNYIRTIPYSQVASIRFKRIPEEELLLHISNATMRMEKILRRKK